MQTKALRAELLKLAVKQKAQFLPKFFKTAKGQYAEGDKFIGVTVPLQRQIAKIYKDLPLLDIQELLNSKFHEERLTALFVLVNQFKKADQKLKQKIYDFYLSNTKNINNWDLVDSSASYIVGNYLVQNPNHITTFRGRTFKGSKILEHLAKSKNLWEKRIAMLAAGEFIKHDNLGVTLKIAKLLLSDKHDLIHKAVGWMLREVGKKKEIALENFLKENYSNIKRTTLRYAIEKFPQQKRLSYLKK